MEITHNTFKGNSQKICFNTNYTFSDDDIDINFHSI